MMIFFCFYNNNQTAVLLFDVNRKLLSCCIVTYAAQIAKFRVGLYNDDGKDCDSAMKNNRSATCQKNTSRKPIGKITENIYFITTK